MIGEVIFVLLPTVDEKYSLWIDIIATILAEIKAHVKKNKKNQPPRTHKMELLTA